MRSPLRWGHVAARSRRRLPTPGGLPHRQRRPRRSRKRERRRRRRCGPRQRQRSRRRRTRSSRASTKNARPGMRARRPVAATPTSLWRHTTRSRSIITTACQPLSSPFDGQSNMIFLIHNPCHLRAASSAEPAPSLLLPPSGSGVHRRRDSSGHGSLYQDGVGCEGLKR